MEKKEIVKLTRPARKDGGDRYESDEGYVIYIPQYISRPTDQPLKTIKITFSS